MEVAILTVGDEVLAGDTENTNASSLARHDDGPSARAVPGNHPPSPTMHEKTRATTSDQEAIVSTPGKERRQPVTR